jgi:dipeptidyl aminopeptidase/acylaminoacyl peptidase
MKVSFAHMLVFGCLALLPPTPALTGGGSTAPAAGAFTLEQVMSAPFPSDLTAASHGNRIAWVFDAEGKRNIWVAEGPKFVARQLTRYNSDDGQEITDLSFSSDGNFLIYVRGGNKNTAGEAPNPVSDPAGVDQAVWVIAWAGGAPRKVDSGRSPEAAPRGNRLAYVKENQVWVAKIAGMGKPIQVIARGQNGSLVWSPDGKKLAFVSNRGMHNLIGIYDTVKETLGYVAPSVDRDFSPRWSADGRSIAFLRYPARTLATGGGGGGGQGFGGRGNDWAIWIADITHTELNTYGVDHAREIWNSSSFEAAINGVLGGGGGGPTFLWAGDRFVFFSEKDGWQHLYSLPVAGGTPQLLTPGECEVEFMSLSPDAKNIFYNSNCGDVDRRHLWRVSVSGGAPEQLTTGEGIQWGVVPTADGKYLTYIASDARNPDMVYVRPASSDGKAQMLAGGMLPKNFPTSQLVVPQQVIFEAADGWKIHGQLFLPVDASSGRRPAIIFMHGGPVRQMLLGWHYLYYYRNSYAMNQCLASRGYVVLSVNYRSGIGYGRGFREAPNRGAGGASEYQDIVAGAKYLSGRPDVDASRIGLWGGSYGGYLTAMGLARNSDLFAVGVDLHGVHDWSQRVAGAGPGAAAPDPARIKLAHDSSPVASVEKWRSPVLLIQGDDDRNVNFDQMVDLVPRLRRQKVEFEQLVFPDEIHDFLLHRHWVEAYRAGADFFDRHLKAGAAAPAGQ